MRHDTRQGGTRGCADLAQTDRKGARLEGTSLAMSRVMQMRSSETHFHAARVRPCLCDPNEVWPHGFTLLNGERDGMYLSVRHTSGEVRWLDLAISVGVGTIALRVWVDLESKTLRCRALSRNEVEGHPAATLGGWLNKVEVAALGHDLVRLTTQVVLGDDRLCAHLWDLPHAATEHAIPARPARPATSVPVRRDAPMRKVLSKRILEMARR